MSALAQTGAALATALTSSTPLLLAATGETVTERAGVLNLGVEGMMLMGAVCAFAAASLSGSALVGVAAGAGAGCLLALLFAALTLGLGANQVASGLAATIFGTGLSSLLGAGFVGHTVRPLARLQVWPIDTWPLVGPLLSQDLLVYGSLAVTAAVSWGLVHTRAGLVLRAVGENDRSAHALGVPVLRVRLAAVLFGGVLAGLGGAYLALAATPMWIEGLTAGRGWIALALVVFGAWRPWRVAAGAFLFGGISVMQLFLQGAGLVKIPSQILGMIPYLATILVLAVISSGAGRVQAPACLGKGFRA